MDVRAVLEDVFIFRAPACHKTCNMLVFYSRLRDFFFEVVS